MEGLSSCDYTGRTHFPIDVPTAKPKTGHLLEEVPYPLGHKPPELKKEETKEEAEEETETTEERQQPEVEEVKKEEKPTPEEGTELVNGRVETEEPIQTPRTPKWDEEIPEIPPRPEGGHRKPIVAPSSTAAETPSQHDLYPLNGLKDPPSVQAGSGELVDKDLLATGLGLIPGQYLRPEHIAQCEKLLFSLLPRTPCDTSNNNSRGDPGNTPQGTPGGTAMDTPIKGAGSPPSRPSGPQSPSAGGSTGLNCLGVQNLSHKELLERLHQSAEALPVPAGDYINIFC